MGLFSSKSSSSSTSLTETTTASGSNASQNEGGGDNFSVQLLSSGAGGGNASTSPYYLNPIAQQSKGPGNVNIETTRIETDQGAFETAVGAFREIAGDILGVSERVVSGAAANEETLRDLGLAHERVITGTAQELGDAVRETVQSNERLNADFLDASRDIASLVGDVGASTERVLSDSIASRERLDAQFLDATVDTAEGVYRVVGDAVDGNERVTGRVIDATSEALDTATNATSEALLTNRDVTARGLQSVDDAVSTAERAILSSEETRRQTLDLVERSQRETLGFVDNLVGRAVDDSLDAVAGIAEQFGSSTERVTLESIDAVLASNTQGNILARDALEGYGLLSSDALDAVEDANRDSLAFADSFIGDVLEFADVSQRSALETSRAALTEINRDAGERTSQVILWVAGGVAATAIISAIFIGRR